MSANGMHLFWCYTNIEIKNCKHITKFYVSIYSYRMNSEVNPMYQEIAGKCELLILRK